MQNPVHHVHLLQDKLAVGFGNPAVRPTFLARGFEMHDGNLKVHVLGIWMPLHKVSQACWPVLQGLAYDKAGVSARVHLKEALCLHVGALRRLICNGVVVVIGLVHIQISTRRHIGECFF